MIKTGFVVSLSTKLNDTLKDQAQPESSPQPQPQRQPRHGTLEHGEITVILELAKPKNSHSASHHSTISSVLDALNECERKSCVPAKKTPSYAEALIPVHLQTITQI